MRNMFNRFALAAVSIGLLLALLLGMVRMLSAPAEGEKLARRYGIPRPAIIAHRGASYLAPEETRPAYLLARELGADYLELDVQRTKDGVLIALHDLTLRRTTNVAEIFPERHSDPVDEFTFAELRQLDAGSWFNRQFPDRARGSFRGLTILRLEEVIGIAERGPSGPGVYIELKHPRRFPGIERQIVETLAAQGWIRPPPETSGRIPTRQAGALTSQMPPARVVFQSFHPESLARLRALAPRVPRLLLITERSMDALGWESLLAKASEVGTGIGTWGYRRAKGRGWSVEHSPDRYLTTWPWYTGEAHRAGLFVHAWTIDDRWEMWMLRLCGADGLFTNRPGMALLTYGRVDSLDLQSMWESIGY